MSARVLSFVRNGRLSALHVDGPDADRVFILVDKFQRLQREQPIAARVIERTIDELLEPDPQSAQCAVNDGGAR
jgi:hypothetical protein